MEEPRKKSMEPVMANKVLEQKEHSNMLDAPALVCIDLKTHVDKSNSLQ
jgi:hypothetical protein